MKEIISLKNVIKLYGQRRAINGVNLHVNENECVAVNGVPSSGKSTLLKLIAGMERPSAGEIFVLGKAVHEMDFDISSTFRNRNIGIVLRNPSFMPELSLLDNVSLPLAVRGVSVLKREKAAREKLKALGISYAAHNKPEKVSIYEAQIASLVRVLVAQPKILLIDEAAAGFTEKETEKFRNVLNDILGLGDYTILSFSAADNDILFADRNVVLDHGIIKEDKL